METLQPSLVSRELKRVLGDHYQISKEARESILLSSNIFVHYITATANEIAKKQKKSTIQPAHIVQALEETGFASFLPDIEAYMSRCSLLASAHVLELERDANAASES